ncbi:MAG: DNA translocase FtsK 4TM domain-containing protein, partial [Propionibacteriaceae bacterium]|nr:DNA translocase FtsK 4TM domain-containing protein [Propionibacteriaceae bacterium]
MATSSRSRTQSSSTRSRKNPSTTRTTKTSTTRKPAKATPAPSAGLLPTLGRGIRTVWNATARGLGRLVRGIGEGAKDIDPAVRRDGVALFMLAFSIVLGAAFWFNLPSVVGRGIRYGSTFVFGLGSYALPLIAVVTAVIIFRQRRSAIASRLLIGWTLIVLGLLGLVSIARGLPKPEDLDAVREAGGMIGYVISSILKEAFGEAIGVWVAVPLLTILTVFGVIVVIGKSLREIAKSATGAIASLLVGRGPAEPSDPVEESIEPQRGFETLPPTDEVSEPAKAARGPRKRKAPVGVETTDPISPERLLAEGVVYQLPDPAILRSGTTPKAKTAASDQIVGALQEVFDEFEID